MGTQVKQITDREELVVLDLFCGAGAASVGYHDAGLKVIGVDIRPQPNYPYEFHRMDAMEVVKDQILIDWLKPVVWIKTPTGRKMRRGKLVVHASPPCQAYSNVVRHLSYPQPKLIEPLRVALEALISGGLIAGYIIENVENAPLLRDRTIMLCGTMFGKRINRHRKFESLGLGLSDYGLKCSHGVDGVGEAMNIYRSPHNVSVGRWMDEMFDSRRWMTQEEARQTIPCCYTEFIGSQIRQT
jgi:DNA (cytosine-5)-methyltransferase 1